MIAVGVHVAVFILFFFIMAWRQPVPPIPEYGIELNFGLDAAGTGETQPQTSPAPTPAQEEQAQEEPEQQEQPAEETEPQEDVAEEPVEESVTQPDPSAATETPAAEKPVEQQVTKPAENKPDRIERTTEKQETQPVDKPATATGNTSQGDDADEAGDKGEPEGTVDARSLYGSQGGGDGPALNLAGWTWDEIPKPQESSNETGRIVFQIKVDDRGEIMQIVTLEKTVSPTVERVYRQAVERLTFSRTAAGMTPPVSTGTITFTIKSR